MTADRSAIISELRSKILRLEGFKSDYGQTVQPSLDPMLSAFPGGVFPIGCIHEFIWSETENFSATGAFTSSLIASWVKVGSVIVWISNEPKVLPTSLPAFSVIPDRVLFIQARGKDLLWVTEEALKCKAVTAVVSEVRDFSFTASRRLQLAVENSNTTGFIIRRVRGKVSTTACVSRWKITHAPSEAIDNLPGLGYPTWSVDLLRVRNGRPATWHLRWSEDHFEYFEPADGIHTPGVNDKVFHQHAQVG